MCKQGPVYCTRVVRVLWVGWDMLGKGTEGLGRHWEEAGRRQAHEVGK